MKNKTGNVALIALVGLMGALCFASNYLSFPLPVPVGPMTRIHLGNSIVLLSGFLLGPVPGGLAAGFGAMFYDLLNPAYVADAPYTFAFKFAMAFVCGLVARLGQAGARRHFQNILAAVAGQAAYIALYLTKTYFYLVYFDRAAPEAIAISMGTKALSSTVNALLAVIVSVPLAFALRAALERAHIGALRQAQTK